MNTKIILVIIVANLIFSNAVFSTEIESLENNVLVKYNEDKEMEDIVREYWRHEKSQILALLFGFFVPTTGHIYVGRLDKAKKFYYGFGGAALLILTNNEQYKGYGNALAMILVMWNCLEARKLAEDHNINLMKRLLYGNPNKIGFYPIINQQYIGISLNKRF